jgi:hypothetical protein
MKKKSYNNIHTIIKNKIFLKKIYNEKNTKKRKKKSYLNVVASGAEREKYS